LLVKFHDSVEARAPLAVGTTIASQRGENLAPFTEILQRHGLKVRQAITKEPARLRTLEQRAAANSKRAQPDLAGMLYVEGASDEVLLRAARELNALPNVEFVEFDQQMVYHVPAPAPSPAPLPLPGEDDPSCTNSEQDCYVENKVAFCSDFACCALVGTINPFCVDLQFGAWDIICADLANLFCDDGDRCLAPITNGGCFDIHPTPGCKNEDCCNIVGEIEPFCIQVTWDETCVILALQNCFTDTEGASPLFTMDAPDPANRWQKYTTFGTVQPGDGFEQTGFTGDGLDIPMLEMLGQILLDEYGVGTENYARGKSVRVGVVEHSAYVTGPKTSEGGERWHEDLNHIIPEPGQTIITIEGGVLSPDHGTATLGQINAADNGFGVTGIAKDAEGWFFPIVSVEEGGRTLNAISAALEYFDKGDVLNYSIGPGGGGTLVSNAGPWTLVRLGSDLGITSVVSAGNDCFNLDDGPQYEEQDSDVIIVGACVPGRVNQDPPVQGLGRFCRLGFSNHCRQCSVPSLVHVSAWGELVCTTGYGDLFAPPNADGNGANKARAYTAGFNGTSAAAPIVAGLVTCLQGLAKQFYGVALTPSQVRSIFVDVASADPSASTFPQCDIPNPLDLPGSTDDAVCGGDYNFQEQPRRIGGFPRAFECGISVIAGNWFAASPIKDVKVVTGDYLFGNQNSVKAVDGNFLAVQSVQRAPGSQGNGMPPAITYIVGGQTVDIEVTAFTGTVADEVTGVAVQVLGLADAGYVILGVYLRDWPNSRWNLLPNIGLAAGGQLAYGATQNLDAPNYVSPEGLVIVRVWTCGLGAVPQHVVYYDFIDVVISDVPGFNPFGGGG
jgi:hypothetical protein